MLRKLIRQMLIAQILSTMTMNICLLIDSLMISRFLGVEAITAYGYASPMILIFSAVSFMIVAGSQVLCGMTMGVGNKKGTNAFFTASFMSVIILSLAGMSSVFIFSDQLCSMLGAGDNVPGNNIFIMTKHYLLGFVLGAPFFMAQQVMIPYMQIAGGRKKMLAAITAMSISDVIFDLLNVFVFKLGIFGMGLASALSYFVAILLAVPFFLDKNCLFRFSLSLLNWRVFADLLKEGIPVLVNQLCLVLLPLTRNHLLNFYGGSRAVAAYSVISSIGSTLLSFGVAMNAVVLTLSSIFYSDRDRKSLTEAMKILLTYAVGVYLVFDMVIFSASEIIVAIFIDDISASGMAALGLRLVAASYIPCAVNALLKNYYQGIRHTRLTTAICVMQNLIITSVCALILGYFFGVTGIWLSVACGEVLSSLLVAAYICMRNKRFSLRLSDILLLSDMNDMNDDNVLSCSINKKEDVVKVSEAADSFCVKRGLAKRSGMFIALAIEEMTNNIIDHGFVNGKGNSIDVRIVVNRKAIMLRIRDNCRNFDPVKYLELHQSDDPSSHIGIRMIMNLVKNARYEQILGLNNLVLTMQDAA